MGLMSIRLHVHESTIVLFNTPQKKGSKLSLLTFAIFILSFQEKSKGLIINNWLRLDLGNISQLLNKAGKQMFHLKSE